MVEAGETGGILDLILQRLSTFIEKIVKLKRDVVSAMIYPAAVIVMAIAAVAVIMIVVIPQFRTDIPRLAWSRRTTSLADANRRGHKRISRRLGRTCHPGCR